MTTRLSRRSCEAEDRHWSGRDLGPEDDYRRPPADDLIVMMSYRRILVTILITGAAEDFGTIVAMEHRRRAASPLFARQTAEAVSAE